MSREYTPKQIEKYKRQKYISALEKCTKNLYKLFKNENCTLEVYKKRFTQLMSELEKLDRIRLDTEHSKRVQEYIDRLYVKTVKDANLSEKDFLNIKSSELTELNRLQKMKNRTKYSKLKHKRDFF